MKVNLRNKPERRRVRTRANIEGTADKPRLTVFRSNKYIYAQLVDDVSGITLVTIDDVTKKVHADKDKSSAAYDLGKQLAERALEKKIDTVVFDKGPYKYHGRVKSFAEGAREGGLAF